MKFIMAHPYVEIRQEIGWTSKQTIEDWYHIKLYEHAILLKDAQYSINHVYDMSYRPIATEFGFLYLHTNQGVRSLCVKEAPTDLIESFKQLKI
ncbi:hypothetical protein ACJ2A9_06545 [Anaerobacillus sp. MEB173]|uniref:hypothetical protein n=1 Tax=Anaerobacillus sp. MEB173 TaxID=3383345 RepID=UPI003F912FBC